MDVLGEAVDGLVLGLDGAELTSTQRIADRLSANLSDRTVELFAGHEAELVPTLAALPTADVVIAMRTWAALAEDSLDDGEAEEPKSRLHLSTLLEGRWRLDGDLEATALRLATGSDDETETPRTPSERRADALVDICRAFLEGREHPPASRHRPHVNVIVTALDLEAGRGGVCVDGVVLDGPSLASLVCDSVMHRVMMADSVVLDYGTSTRVVSANLFNALVVTDPSGRLFTSHPPGKHPRPPPEMFAA
ncbi:MAG: DUF222 domain-containing protein [Acidimicrobiales bacterium]